MDGQTIRLTLLFEFTTLRKSPSLLPAFFVLTSSERFPFGILGQVWYLIVSIPDLCHLSYFENGLSQNLAICSTMADFYNTNLFDLVNCNFPNITVHLNLLGLVRSHDCHKLHRSKMVAITR